MSATCEQIGDELVAFLDGELGDEERRPIAAHVATCLVCRRELERLSTLHGWMARLPRIEPTPSFAAAFFERLAAEEAPPATNVRRLRPLRWSVPALAAAAVLVLALHSQLRVPPPPVQPSAPPVPVAAAPAVPAAKVPDRVATQPKPATNPDEAPQLANVESIRPEDLPAELLEHPELFLRLPVVRRLETLQYFGSAHDQGAAEDGAG